MKGVHQHFGLHSAHLAGLDDDRASGSDCRRHLENVPNGLLPSYRSSSQPPGRDLSAARWAWVPWEAAARKAA